MNKTEVRDQKVLTFLYNSAPGAKLQKKKKDQWCKVLGTFDIIKNKTSLNKTKHGKKYSIRNKKTTMQQTRIANPSQSRVILSSSLINTINERNCSQANLNESEILWSSSNEESDNSLGIAISNKRTVQSRFKDRSKASHHETDIIWSSSNESENEENVSLDTKSRILRCKKYLKRKICESEINWSSSNESEHECSSTQVNHLCAFQKKYDSACELDSFVREIEKDLRRTKKMKLKLTTKKGGYVDSFRRAVNKAKSDTGFLDYEQRAEIICGCKGVIIENKESYGSCLGNVQLEAGSNCYILLGKDMQARSNGSAVVCFLDESHGYTVDSKKLYVQPNKVIRA